MRDCTQKYTVEVSGQSVVVFSNLPEVLYEADTAKAIQVAACNAAFKVIPFSKSFLNVCISPAERGFFLCVQTNSNRVVELFPNLALAMQYLLKQILTASADASFPNRGWPILLELFRASDL